MMRKRGRENPCFICGHYHKFEEGEVCGICGHKKTEAGEGEGPLVGAHLSAFPTEIIPNFLYLGTYDNASRSELLKAQGISYILNAVATCPNLYRNSFTYFSMPESPTIPYDDCFKFLEQARNGGARVLVHCMSGQSRSPSIVAAYFMRREGLSLEEAVTFVKEKRPTVNLAQAIMTQLVQYASALSSGQANGRAASNALQQQAQESQTHLQQSSGSLQFDMSLVSSQNPSLASGVPGHLTFLGSSSGGNQPQHQQEVPPPGSGVPPMFSFQPPMPPQGFVFGAGGHAPPQGSGQ